MKRRAFCPKCAKKGRTSGMFVTKIPDVVQCATCHSYFKGENEVEINVKTKPKSNPDLKNMIEDWYRCPLCHKVLYGLMQWAEHTAQEHGMDSLSFENKYGVEKSYFGTGWEKYFNPSSRRDEDE